MPENQDHPARPYGVLKPLPVPENPWQHRYVDFVTGLPESNGFDAICVFVDRLTKQRHLVTLPYGDYGRGTGHPLL